MAEKGRWKTAEDQRDCPEAARRRDTQTSCGHHLTKTRFLEHLTGKSLSDSTVRRLLKKMGFSRKKGAMGAVGAMERDECLRTAWRVMVAGTLDPQRLVFVDEMGANIALCPLYAWSRCGERVHMKVLRNRRPNTALLSSMSVVGMGRCLAVEGSTNAAVFETYLEMMLTLTLEPGQVVVTDNLAAHKGRGAKVTVISNPLQRLSQALVDELARSRAFASTRCAPGGSMVMAAVTEFCLRTRTACSHNILSLAVIA